MERHGMHKEFCWEMLLENSHLETEIGSEDNIKIQDHVQQWALVLMMLNL
jgi:hypothetical protein